MANLFSPCHPEMEPCDFLYTCYAMQTQAVEDAINELARTANPNDTAQQREILAAYGLNIDALTGDEITYIENEVTKRCLK